MKCTFAFLVDDTIHNYVRKKSIEINKIIKKGFLGSLLPPHISLKQPFAIDDIESVEKYFDRLSSEIKPMKLKIGPTYLWENVIGLNVQETNELRECHNKINKELKSICKNSTALYDGSKYHFHLTIALSGKDKDEYKRAYEILKDDQILFECEINKIVMFYYDDDNYQIGTFITYKVNELKK